MLRNHENISFKKFQTKEQFYESKKLKVSKGGGGHFQEPTLSALIAVF